MTDGRSCAERYGGSLRELLMARSYRTGVGALWPRPTCVDVTRMGQGPGLRRVHGIAQMRDAGIGDDCRIREDDRCVREVVEQPHSCS